MTSNSKVIYGGEFWSIWARAALRRMNAREMYEGYEDEREALADVAVDRREPYHSLKGFVVQHGLEKD